MCQPDETFTCRNEQDCLSWSSVDVYGTEEYIGTHYREEEICGVHMQETETDNVVNKSQHKSDGIVWEKNEKTVRELRKHTEHNEFSGSGEPDINKSHEVDKDWVTDKAMCQPVETSTDGDGQGFVSLSSVCVENAEEYMDTHWGEEESGVVLMQGMGTDNLQLSSIYIYIYIYAQNWWNSVWKQNMKQCKRNEKTKHHEWAHEFSGIGEPEITQRCDVHEEWVTDKMICRSVPWDWTTA